jgi:hypothetical protein
MVHLHPVSGNIDHQWIFRCIPITLLATTPLCIGKKILLYSKNTLHATLPLEPWQQYQ